MFKVYKKDSKTTVINIVMVDLSLTLNIFHTFFSAFIVDFEQLNVGQSSRSSRGIHQGNLQNLFRNNNRDTKKTTFCSYSSVIEVVFEQVCQYLGSTCFWSHAEFLMHKLKVQSCKLYNNKYMIASNTTNSEVFKFIAVLIFK